MTTDVSDDDLVLEVGTSRTTGYYRTTVYIALLAIFTALTTVATIVIVIPFPYTGGYFNLGDALVMISGILLGPLGGFIAGGLGSALGDVALGYAAFAPLTFVVKGTEGFLVGLATRYCQRAVRITMWDIIGVAMGALAMLLGYFLGEVYILQITWEQAFLELITINTLQVIAGGVVSLAVGPIARRYLLEFVVGR